MKKLAILLFVALCAAGVYAAEKQDADSIAEIADEKASKQQVPGGAPETVSATVKKGEGFDFKVPEILITGQIDTRILLTREIKSLENLQDVKNMIYEKEKMNLPYSYLKEDEIAPQMLEMPAQKDFMARLRVWAGTLSTFGAEGILGKAFDRYQSAVIAVSHENSDNAVINDRQTYSNNNSGKVIYTTEYDGNRAIYAIDLDSYQYINPYPQNVFGRHAIGERARVGLNLDGNIGGFDYGALVNYAYFGRRGGDNSYIVKENRAGGRIEVERDVNVEGMKKAKTMLEVDSYYSDFDALDSAGVASMFSLNSLLRGIMNFEPLILQAGARVQVFRSADTYLRVSPYLSAYYDFLPQLSAYAEFAPKMENYDFIKDIKLPFVKANGALKPSVDNIDFRIGTAFELPFMFADIYYGIKSVNAMAALDRVPGTNVLAPYNYDFDYNSAGLKAETKILSGFRLKAGYEYRMPSAGNRYMPPFFSWNILTLSVSFDKAEWSFGLTGRGASQAGINPAFLSLDAAISRKISENLKVFGYVNNILNAEYYMLYYYEEKPFNLGVGVTIDF